MASLFDESGKAKEFINKLTAIPGRQAYFLDVPGTESAKALSVVEFHATEMMGGPSEVRIVATHPLQLSRADYLSLDAAFRIVPDDGVERKFSGFIERISTVKTSKDFSEYEIVLKSHFGRLAAVHNTQIYQHQSTPDIIAAVLRRHGIKEHEMSFRLRNRYPKHLFRFQYRVDDLTYVQMLMQKAGIYCYIVETEYGDQVVFADDIDHYLYEPRLIVPYREAAGLEAGGAEAITSLKTHNVTVPQSYTVADYNPESAWERFKDSANLAPQDPTTYGQPYIYGTHHLDQQGARWEAQLRHEVALARQVVYEGESNVLELQCARVLETDITLPDAPKGQVIVEITHSGARDKPYTNRYKAIPADRRFRLEMKPDTWPKIAGTLSARICSPDKYTYGYLNSVGYYVVRFDVDFAEWPKGGESVPLRLAKPFAGKLQTGMHFVALDNDEAVISFRDGDPDKPEIVAFHHHSQARDLITNDRRWLSRNVIRTQKNNKLRMEDWGGQEGIKLSTEHSGKSQLNLGYLVNNKLEYRGETISLFAQKLGIKIFAAKGPVQFQAQSGPMSLTAARDVDVDVGSVNGKVQISAAKELILECGGAFIQLKDGNITLGGPEDLFFKVITIQKKGAASMHIPASLPPVPIEQNADALYTQTFDASTVVANQGDGMTVASQPYRVYLPDGTIKQQGVLVEGATFSVSTAEPVKVRCEIGAGDWGVVEDAYDHDESEDDIRQA